MALWLVRAGKYGGDEARALEVYDKLPDNIQAELPLKWIWVPVLEDE
jgi:hypothetical protein